MCGRPADMQTNAMAMKAELVCSGTAVAWKYIGVAKGNEMPDQVNMVDCGLFTCKAVENLVDCLPLVGSGDGSRRGGFNAGQNACMNRRRLIVLIGQDAGWAAMPAAAPQVGPE